MPRFHYIGKDINGLQVEGYIRAENQEELESSLMKKGVFLESHHSSLSPLQQKIIRLFKAADITRSTRQLQILLASKVTVIESLDLVADQIRDRNLLSVFMSIIAKVQSGRALADAFKDYPFLFDDLYTSMIEAGESSGRLDFAFERIATYREKQETTTRKIRSALAYPFLVILVAILVVLALILYVVPVFSSMYENFNSELPALTKIVVGFSDTLRNQIWLWVVGFLTIITSIIGLVMTNRFKYLLHLTLVRTPIIRDLVLKLVSARFCRTFGALLTSGVDILIALQIASKTTGNKYVVSRIEPAGLMLVEGKTLSEALTSTNIFPRTVLRLCASGEKTGQLGEMLSRAADYYESDADSAITTLTTLIEPLIIILLGILVAFILIAMYLPLFELVGTI